MASICFRALQSPAVAYQLHIKANGVTRFGLSHDAIKSLWVSLPPLAEQVAIGRFLDHADRRIQRYIRAKQKLIALLEEQKQAIIHQAITGQIDVRTGQPYPSYKDSGAEWLGEVPAHWQVRRLGQIGRLSKGNGGNKEDEASHRSTVRPLRRPLHDPHLLHIEESVICVESEGRTVHTNRVWRCTIRCLG